MEGLRQNLNHSPLEPFRGVAGQHGANLCQSGSGTGSRHADRRLLGTAQEGSDSDSGAGPSKPAQELLHQIVNHKFEAASISPAVQAAAAAALQGWLTIPQSSVFTLDAVVTDKAGQPVSGLAPSEFTLLDNNQPQTPLSVQEAKGLDDAATEVILVVDSVNTIPTVMDQERIQLARFLEENDGQLALPTSLLLLNDRKDILQSTPTRDGKALEKIFRDHPGGLREFGISTGGFGAAERELISLRALDRLAVVESKKPSRKLLIWISPGWPIFWEADKLKGKRGKRNCSRRSFCFLLSCARRA